MKDWYVQYTYNAKSRDEARRVFRAYRSQQGFVGGRIYLGTRVQAFFEDNTGGGALPEGMLRVHVPPNVQRALGVKLQKWKRPAKAYAGRTRRW